MEHGTPIWEFKTRGFVDSSPAIGSDGTVYVGSDDKKLYAINGKSGVKLWEFRTGGGVGSSPAIGSDGTVYVGSDKLYAINGKSGVKLWEFETGGWVTSSPAIGPDGTVYVGSGDNKLYAIKTGVVFTASAADKLPPEKVNTMIEALSRLDHPPQESGKRLKMMLNQVLDATRGEPRFVDLVKKFDVRGREADLLDVAKLWEFETGNTVYSSPAIGSDGTVYVGSDDKKLYAINGKSGVKLWEFETGDLVFSSPAIGSDGTVYVGSEDKKLYALSGKSGVKLWEFKTEGWEDSRAQPNASESWRTGGWVNSSPAIGPDGTVYVGSEDKKLYALSGKSGVKLWEFKAGDYGGRVCSSPAIGSDGTVYVGSNDYKLYAINGKSGVKLWEFETGYDVTSSPAIGSDGTVYVGSQDKKVYAIKTDSKGPAKSPWPMRGQNARHTGRVLKT